MENSNFNHQNGIDSSPNLAALLNKSTVRDHVLHWLKEDMPSFDYGGFVVGEAQETALLLCKSEGVLAGVPFFNAVFQELGCNVEWKYPEGMVVKPISTIATVKGSANRILLGERLALNCLSRASGVATKAKKLVEIKKAAKWAGEIAGTRKTTPGFRIVEKYALLVGGASMHRYDLSSMIMLKDNHIWTAGNIPQAVTNARTVGGFSVKIEVECRSVEEARSAASAGADIVMLDNFLPDALHPSAEILKREFPNLLVEASGGIREDNISDYFNPNVDVISLGSLTHGYKPVNFSLKILKEGHNPHNPPVAVAQ